MESVPQAAGGNTDSATVRRGRLSLGLLPRIVALAAITALISGGLVAVLSIKNSRGALENQVLDGFLSEADLAAGFSERHISQSESALAALAAQPFMQTALESDNTEGLQAILQAFLAVQSSFDNVGLIDLNGDPIIRAVDSTPAVNLADREWFQTTLATRAPYLGTPVYSRGSGSPVVVYAIPLLDDSGNVTALLTGSISLKGLSDAMALANVERDSRITLVDRRAGGVVLVAPDLNDILTPFVAAADVDQAVLDGGRVAMNSQDAGEETLVAVAPVGELPWSVVVQQSGDTAFAAIGGLTRSSLLLVIPVIAVAMVISAVLAMQITRPISRLTWAAQGLAAGRRSRRLNFERSDEIGELGRVFDLMADSIEARAADLESAVNALRHEVEVRSEAEAALQAASDELEQRVEERTEELEQALGSYQEIFNTATDAIFIHDIETGELVDVNDEASALQGRSKDEILDLSLNSIASLEAPYGPVEARELVRRAVEEGPQHFEWQIEHADGYRIWVDVRLRTAVIAGKQRVLAMVTDITARKSAADALRVSEEMLRLTLESVTEYAIFMLDTAGKVTAWNTGAEQLLGYAPAEIIGTHYSVFRVGAEDEDPLARARIDGSFEEEGWRRRKDGTIFWAHVAMTPALGQDGNLRGFVKVVRDRTAEREAENRLQYSEQRFRSLIERSHEGIWMTDAAGIILYSSPSVEHMLGWSSEELLGLEAGSLAHPDDRETRMQNRAKLLAEPGGVTTLIWRLRRKDGTYRWMEAVSTNLMETPAVNAIVNNIRDITERRELEEAIQVTLADLRRSNADLEHFAYVASHDLQEPLRMVSNYTQLLARRYRGRLDEDADEFVNYAVEGATRMQQLIEDLLRFSRVGTQGKEPEPVEAEAVLDRALFSLQTAIAESGAVVTHDPLPAVMGDEIQLAQLVQNLVSNAIKFHGPETPRIHVSSEPDGDRVRFCVRDNGIGIDPRFQDRIFVIFQRLHSRAEYPGTGIGLAVCKRIVERHGGEMWVESAVGDGSSFYFTLKPAVSVLSGQIEHAGAA